MISDASRVGSNVCACLQELQVESQNNYKLEPVNEDLEAREVHRKEAHRLASKTSLGPEV